MRPSDGWYRRDHVRLADLTVLDDMITDLTFEECTILGPGVVAPLAGTSIERCSWDGGDFSSLIWVIPEDRPQVIGAVGLLRCRFIGCRFTRIGLAIPEAQVQGVRENFGG